MATNHSNIMPLINDCKTYKCPYCNDQSLHYGFMILHITSHDEFKKQISGCSFGNILHPFKFIIIKNNNIFLNSNSGYSQYQARLAIFKSRILDCMKTDNFIEQFYDDMSSLLTGVSGSIFYDEIRRKYALPPAIFGKFI